MLESGVAPDQSSEKRSHHFGARIDFHEAFYLATTGGGVALNLPIGKFAPGYQFDAIVIDATAALGTIRLWDDLDHSDNVLQKIVYAASKPNISKVWVGGRQIA